MKTEEERREAKKQYDKKRYQANREKILEQHKQYYQVKREKFAEYNKQWREANSEYNKQYYQANREKLLEQKKQYSKYNAEKRAEYFKQRYQTPMGRASYLVNAHKREDKKYNRGECTLTAKWIVDHIFSQKCIYCGESDWRKLGCDRKDNSLPHTPSNVVPCCASCNKKRQKKPFEEFVAECNAQERLKEWEAFLAECEQKSLETVCLN